MDQKQIAILNKMEKEPDDDNENHNQDSEYLFTEAIAADGRAFSEAEQCMIKHEINNIIFKYQRNSETTISRMQTPKINHLLKVSDFSSNCQSSRVSSRASSSSGWQSNSYESQVWLHRNQSHLMTRENTITNMVYISKLYFFSIFQVVVCFAIWDH